MKYEVLRDPVKAEWVVVADSATKGHRFMMPVHPFYDFARNAEFASRICDLLELNDHQQDNPAQLPVAEGRAE